MFQQKLEEEVKKDQQEKKENQETLKTLKMEIKELADLNERSDALISFLTLFLTAYSNTHEEERLCFWLSLVIAPRIRMLLRHKG